MPNMRSIEITIKSVSLIQPKDVRAIHELPLHFLSHTQLKTAIVSPIFCCDWLASLACAYGLERGAHLELLNP